jgi:hypothetical protein
MQNDNNPIRHERNLPGSYRTGVAFELGGQVLAGETWDDVHERRGLRYSFDCGFPASDDRGA